MIVLALHPGLSSIETVSNNDKLFHALEFFIFVCLLLSTLLSYGSRDAYLISFIAVLLLVLVTEIGQLFILTRSATIADGIADASGAAVGFILVYLVNWRWKLFKQ